MKIVHLATEFAMVAKAGGLGDVLLGLGRELVRQGQNVEVILPKYDTISPTFLSDKRTDLKDFVCEEGGSLHRNTMWKIDASGFPLLLLEAHHPKRYFSRGKIYGCEDDTARFLYFSKACLEYLKAKKTPIDVLHLHDWPVAIAALLVKEIYRLPIKSVVLTIHNAEYQGLCASWDLDAIGLAGENYLTEDLLQDERYPEAINLLKGAIIYADAIAAVSPSYAKEILTEPYGGSLSPVLRKYRGKIVGILNGIDHSMWNPAEDKALPLHYNNSLSIDAICKAKESARLQIREQFHLDLMQRPWVGSITRLVPQKGPELIEEALLLTLEQKGSFILLGSSPIPAIQDHFDSLKKKYASNRNVLLYYHYNETLAHQLFAALDLLIAPSRFEPCGLTQLIAMRYGTVPLVRATGGLQDTVFDFENEKITADKRNGFVFHHSTKADFTHAFLRAIDQFRRNKESFRLLLKRGMQLDYSWKKPTREYIKLYEDCKAR